jgi:hypothetical protein
MESNDVIKYYLNEIEKNLKGPIAHSGFQRLA